MLSFYINEDERVNSDLPGLNVIYNSFSHQSGFALTYGALLNVKSKQNFRWYGTTFPSICVEDATSVTLAFYRTSYSSTELKCPLEINPQYSSTLRIIRNELGS